MITIERQSSSLFQSCITDEMKEAGLGQKDVWTDTAHIGIYYSRSLSTKEGERLFAVDLFPTKKDAAFHNLTTKTNALLTGILFHTKADVVRAIGIEYRERDSSKATKHTLVEPRAKHYLYCGAIHSPQLLKMSGIGDASSHYRCA